MNLPILALKNKGKRAAMGFLNFWQQEKSNYEEQASQLTTSGDSQDLTPKRKRVDGAIVNRRFNKAIKDNGGDGDVYSDAVITETEELFGCTLGELYQKTGGKRRDRSTLPQPAQEAYMVNESITANELERYIGTIGGEDQAEVNERIIGVVRQQSQQTRKWLPW